MKPASFFDELAAIVNDVRHGVQEQLRQLQHIKPPQWLDDAVQPRMVLLLNHLLQQNPEAQPRLLPHKGKVMLLQWPPLALRLQVTPAGLFDVADAVLRPDLTMTVDGNALQLAKDAMQNQPPATQVEGDTALAEEVRWLFDNVRWDGQADLARLTGEGAASQIAQVTRQIKAALTSFVDRVAPAPASKNKPPHDDGAPQG